MRYFFEDFLSLAAPDLIVQIHLCLICQNAHSLIVKCLTGHISQQELVLLAPTFAYFVRFFLLSWTDGLAAVTSLAVSGTKTTLDIFHSEQ